MGVSIMNLAMHACQHYTGCIKRNLGISQEIYQPRTQAIFSYARCTAAKRPLVRGWKSTLF
jgi:hypothetical protein